MRALARLRRIVLFASSRRRVETELSLAAFVLSACALAVSFGCAYSIIRARRAVWAPGASVPYEGPRVGDPWPLPTAEHRSLFVALTKRCPPCQQLLSDLREEFSRQSLHLVVMGPPLEEAFPPSWSVEGLSFDEARRRLGLVVAPYGIVVVGGRVAAHSGVNGVSQLRSLLDRVPA